MSRTERETTWLKVLILCMGGGIIYILPYLRFGYYDAMIEGMNLTNSQLGYAAGAYGFIGAFGYLMGGILADQFKARNLLVFSFVGTGLCGFFMATLPGFVPLMIVHGIMGITISLAFWPAFMKIVRFSASSENQGKIFGTVTGGRKLASLFIAAAGMWIFGLYPKSDQVSGFQFAVTFFSSLHIIVGLLFLVAWKSAPDDKAAEGSAKNAGQMFKELVRDLKTVFRIKEMWILIAALYGIYACYRFSDIFTPYLSQGIGITALMAGIIGYGKNYGSASVGSIVTGFLTDKIGRVKWPVTSACIAVALKCLFFFIPVGASVAATVNIVLFMVCIYPVYPMIFALLDEAGIPEKYSGTVIGLMSCIGFMGETVAPAVSGWALDAFPQGLAGFKIVFAVSIVHGIFGIGMLLFFAWHVKRKSEQQAPAPQTEKEATAA